MSAGLRLDFRPSYSLAAAMMAAHGVAAFAVVRLMPGVAGLALGGALLALGLAAAWTRALLRGRTSVRAFTLGRRGAEVAVQCGSAPEVLTRLAADRLVSRHLVILRFGSPLRRAVLVTPDMLDADDFRRLRIWALWGKLPGVAAEQLAA